MIYSGISDCINISGRKKCRRLWPACASTSNDQSLTDLMINADRKDGYLLGMQTEFGKNYYNFALIKTTFFSLPLLIL